MTDDAAIVARGGSADRRRFRPEAPETRGRARIFWDAFFAAIRAIGGVVRNFYATFGIFLSVGAAMALGGTYLFARFAGHVTSGRTQEFDDAVLRWIATQRSPTLDPIALEITFLGTATVVLALVAVSGMFLWLSQHRYSALLLLISTTGGIVLNNLLKVGYSRPRPQVVEWGTHAVTWSFPSGHAMSAAVVYGTVAYLAARLQRRHLYRVLTLVAALILILLIAGSRLYLGVHYPSDVAAGIIIGLSWAAFCMATLEGIQLYAKRRAPEVLRQEKPAPPAENAAPSEPRSVDA
jgi:undecaprenyl-diphosphatase